MVLTLSVHTPLACKLVLNVSRCWRTALALDTPSDYLAAKQLARISLWLLLRNSNFPTAALPRKCAA